MREKSSHLRDVNSSFDWVSVALSYHFPSDYLDTRSRHSVRFRVCLQPIHYYALLHCYRLECPLLHHSSIFDLSLSHPSFADPILYHLRQS